MKVVILAGGMGTDLAPKKATPCGAGRKQSPEKITRSPERSGVGLSPEALCLRTAKQFESPVPFGVLTVK